MLDNAENKGMAQKRADQVVAFRDELIQLGQDGVLKLSTAEQASVDTYHKTLLTSLARRYDIDVDAKQKQLSIGMKLASFVGALALATSIFFLFYQFWGYFSTAAQVVILVSAPLLTLGLTVVIARHETNAYFAKQMSLVSFACFVLNLSMLGQIFTISPSENALLVWAAYALLLAYRFDVRLLLAAGILSFTGFIAARVGTWSGMYWLSMGERPEHFLVPALIIFCVPVWWNPARYRDFDPIYRVFGALLFLFPVLILSNWGYASYFDWPINVIEGMYQVAGFVLSAALIWLGVRNHWADTVNTGNVFFVLFLYTKVFDWWWEIMPKWLFFLVIALITMLMLLVFKRVRLAGQSGGVSHE